MLGVFATESGHVQEVTGMEANRWQRRQCIGTDRRMERC